MSSKNSVAEIFRDGCDIVGYQPLRGEGILFQKLAYQFQSGVLVALGLDQHVENLALGVDGTP